MFEKMTKREKVLAASVGALVPLAGFFMALIWFIQSYNANEVTIQGLQRDKRTQQEKLDARDRANQRKKYYEHVSFPSDVQNADVEYQFWLRDLVESKVGMKFQGLNGTKGAEAKFGKEVVYQVRNYKLTSLGTLDQLTKFLHEFYQLPLMQRISKINVTPRTAANVGEKRRIRTGQHSFLIQIEVLGMPKADPDRDFVNEERIEPPRALEEYDDAIVYRNIFGPANNTPTVDTRLSGRIYPNTDIQFRLTGQDADENDELTYELVDCPLPGAVIEVSEGGRAAVFKAEGAELGTYEFKIRVADNGYPAKSSLTDVKLEIVERPNSRPSFVTDRSIDTVMGEPLAIEIVAEDDNEDDELVFELVESDIEDGKLEIVEGRKVKYVGTVTESGEYDFRIKVTDNGKEPMDTTRTFTVNVNPPAFLMASQTQITAILNSRKGDMCWINVRPMGKLHKLQVGETFEVDKQSWAVETIDVKNSSVWLRHGELLKLYRTNDFLTGPRKQEKVSGPLVTRPATSTPVSGKTSAGGAEKEKDAGASQEDSAEEEAVAQRSGAGKLAEREERRDD